MMLVDVHAHLDEFDEGELGVLMEKAQKIGLKTVITNGTNPRTNRTCLALAEKYKLVKPALGLYPTNALEMKPEEIDAELEFIAKSKNEIVAVGEVGLDYYWITDKNEQQKEIFAKIIKLCEKLKKPIIVHSRKAEEDVVAMLEKSKIKHIIMHCFGGRLSLVKRCRDYGWYFSIPANIGRSSHFQRIVEEVPISQLLTETDSPYLSPVGKSRNDPTNVLESVKKIAEIKKLDPEECSKLIYMNYQKIF
jgi:TatD DNase family protein